MKHVYVNGSKEKAMQKQGSTCIVKSVTIHLSTKHPKDTPLALTNSKLTIKNLKRPSDVSFL
jgi:hypothetical protein